MERGPLANCDIIEQAMKLALSARPYGKKLKGLCALASRSASFEEGLLYLWRAEKREFALEAASAKAPSPGLYGENDGAASIVRKRKKPLVLRKKGGRGKPWQLPNGKAVFDAGLAGFESVDVYPLKAANMFYGVLYLKSRRGVRSIGSNSRTLGIVAQQILEVVKCAELAKKHRMAHEELDEARSRLLNSEKLLALGDMAATLAHDIRNPLLSIGGYATRLKKHLVHDAEGLAYVDSMLGGVQRVERLVDGMVRFIKDSSVDLKPEEMNGIVEDSVRVFEEEAHSHGIKVIKDLQPGGLPVLADREQLKIAFDNLIANAIQSMEKGGALTVATSMSGGNVLVKVGDSGGGIDPKNLGRIFSPFFTTKKSGTGLGLPIASAIVARHHGRIEVENRAGSGVTFIMKFNVVKNGAHVE